MKRNIILAIMCTVCTMTALAQGVGGLPTKGFAVFKNDGQFKPYVFTRHTVGDNEIQIEILYAGICHSDIHHVREDWGPVKYPMASGHEISGSVVKVGRNVTKFKVGDYVGIGCMIGSYRHCEACEHGLEQYCEEDAIMTYHDIDRYNGNEPTQGGYSDNCVVAEDFAIKIPANAEIEKVAPLLCAGITTYSPIRYAGVKKGDKVGVAGFGGLEHLTVQYLVKLGSDVTIFDVTEAKRADVARMGATYYVNMNNSDELQGLNKQCDFILSSIPAKYDPVMYVKMLKLNGDIKFRYGIDMQTLK